MGRLVGFQVFVKQIKLLLGYFAELFSESLGKTAVRHYVLGVVNLAQSCKAALAGILAEYLGQRPLKIFLLAFELKTLKGVRLTDSSSSRFFSSSATLTSLRKLLISTVCLVMRAMQ